MKSGKSKKELKVSERNEIRRILRLFQFESSLHTIKKIFKLYKKIRTSLREGTKYRDPFKLIPISIYFYYKMVSKNAPLLREIILPNSSITEREFNAFLYQIISHIPRYIREHKLTLKDKHLIERLISSFHAEGKEFRINDYLSLKFFFNKTFIMVNGMPFSHCKYLLLNIPVSKIDQCDSINSIDEASEVLNQSMETSSSIAIPPEDEFWGHCSNLQAWAEHNYDTRLLHSNLAFPLLRELTKAGDPIAKRVFKEEIAERLLHSIPSVVEYLLLNDYLDYLDSEEYEAIIQEILDEENIPNVKVLKNLYEAGDYETIKVWFYNWLYKRESKC